MSGPVLRGRHLWSSGERSKYERYLRVVRWADRRYRRNGLLTLSVGGQPAPYKRIEGAAARRYLGI